MKDSKRDPPKEQKESLTKRFLKFMTPKKYHRYLTPEVFVAWNLSTYVTTFNILFLQNFGKIAGWFSAKVVPLLQKAYKAAEDVIGTLVDLTYTIVH